MLNACIIEGEGFAGVDGKCCCRVLIVSKGQRRPRQQHIARADAAPLFKEDDRVEETGDFVLDDGDGGDAALLLTAEDRRRPCSVDAGEGKSDVEGLGGRTARGLWREPWRGRRLEEVDVAGEKKSAGLANALVYVSDHSRHTHTNRPIRPPQLLIFSAIFASFFRS